LLNLGYIAQHQGDYSQVAMLIAESVALFQKLRIERGILHCLVVLAGVVGGQGQPERAARLFGVVEAQHEAFGTRIEPSDRNEYNRNLAAVRAQLDEAAFAVAWAEGRVTTMEQAIEYALAETRLSDRLAQGYEHR
jgi:non-specific serine/threonine protein kinase